MSEESESKPSERLPKFAWRFRKKNFDALVPSLVSLAALLSVVSVIHVI